MEHLFVASGSITVFILLLILGKKGKVIADHIMVGILLILVANFISLFLLNLNDAPFPNWKTVIFEFSEASIFLYGPLLWLYTLSLTRASFEIKKKHLLHFIPFIIAFGYFLIGLFTPVNVGSSTRNFLLVLKLSSILLYNVACLRLLAHHQYSIQHIFSNIDKKKLDWLRFLCWSILVIGFIACISLLLDRLTLLTIPQYGGIVTNIALCLFVFALGYFGFKQEFIFQQATSSNNYKKSTKYSKSGLDPEESNRIYKKLCTHIENKKSYMDPDLNLINLAEQLDLQPNHLSQVINSQTGSNFYDFINRYRVEEVKMRIASDEVSRMTLLGIGISSGFSSKSTFNRAFKKHTGQTPSKYYSILIRPKTNASDYG